MKCFPLLFTLLGVLLLGVSARPAALAASFPITVTDVLGRQVTIKACPQRIVSLAPSNTERLFAIGAGDQVVGVTIYDNYPPQVQSLAKVGGYVGKSISIEKIISLKPDLVFSRGTIQQPAIVALEQVGIPVVALEPGDFAAVYDTILLLGRLTDHDASATQVVASMRQRVASIQAKIATLHPTERVTVFYKMYDEPLLTVGSSTFIGHMITMAGGINIFADLSGSYPQVSAEEVLRRNPAVILGPLGPRADLAVTRTLQQPGWHHLAAVRNRRIHLLDDDLVSRPGPRLAEGLEAVAKALYPALFP